METTECEAIFRELAEASWDRFHDTYYNERVDDVLAGALIASLVGSGYALIGLNSDGTNHHLRLERMDQSTRLILRLTHLSEDLTVAQVRGRHASVIIGFGERCPNLAKIWGRFDPEVKSLYSPAWEPGIISFDADMASQFIYAQISLILDLDRYIGEDFQVNLKLFGSHVEAVVDCLKRYLHGRLGKPADESPPPRSPAHLRELQESHQEILLGEVIKTMGEADFPVIGIVADVDSRRVRFRAQHDRVLYSVLVGLEPDRSAAGATTLIIQGETKNYLAETAELLALYESLQKLKDQTNPHGIALSYRMNSIFARKDKTWRHEAPPGSSQWREDLRVVLVETIAQLREQLVSYKKSPSPFTRRMQIRKQSRPAESD